MKLMKKDFLATGETPAVPRPKRRAARWPSGCTPSTRSRTARVGSPNAIRTAATRSHRAGKRAGPRRSSSNGRRPRSDGWPLAPSARRRAKRPQRCSHKIGLTGRLGCSTPAGVRVERALGIAHFVGSIWREWAVCVLPSSTRALTRPRRASTEHSARPTCRRMREPRRLRHPGSNSSFRRKRTSRMG